MSEVTQSLLLVLAVCVGAGLFLLLIGLGGTSGTRRNRGEGA